MSTISLRKTARPPEGNRHHNDSGHSLEILLGRALTSDWSAWKELESRYGCPSYTEIAETLNLPIGSIGPMRMRALQMLRRTPEPASITTR